MYNIAVKWTALQLRILEIAGSNNGPEARNTDFFFWNSPVPQEKCTVYLSNFTITAAFHLSLPNQHKTPRYTIRTTESLNIQTTNTQSFSKDILFTEFSRKGNPCDDGMTRSDVLNGADGFQIRRVVADAINEPTQKADVKWSKNWGWV